MEWQEIEVDGRHTVKISDLPCVPLTTSPSQSPDTSELLIGKKIGGILRHGEWGWLARYSLLQIVSLRNGQTIANYEFCESRGYESCCIKSVEEIFPNNPEIMLLAIVLESFSGPGGGCSYVAVYSVESSKVLQNIELGLHLTCARFMEASACRRSLLQNFDGCLAVGTEEGAVVLLDMNVHKLMAMQDELNDDMFVPCHIVDFSLPLTEIHRNFRQCQQDGIHFGLQMEVIESPCAIQCLLPIDLILGLAIGLEDGRLALYDLMELQIFYVALPPSPEITMSSLVKMDFLEPSDDPRPCLFIWTLHENGENLHAVLHSLMYEKRLVDEEDSLTYFETFQAYAVRLQLPLEATNSTALACQSISSVSLHGEDDAHCLCVISWLSVLEGRNKLLIFDLNQWYKEEMPFLIEYGKQPNYLAGYILSGEYCGLQTLINPNSIAHFNSMQRFEEHFYPNSLSFESLLLHTEGCCHYNWEGAQNRVINLLRSSNAAIFLEPNFYFNEIIRTRLMPQFIELNLDSTFSRNAKCEILLSAALEHNCVSLLRDCAKSWIDGSFMGNFSATTGLSLSTLTDWIWRRATCIKSRCNDLCKSLFEFGGYPLDSREQKELSFITRQLKLLAELLKEILVYAKKQIPERVFNDLANKQSSLSMASNYQDILLWLLNIGLLPEASPHNNKINASSDLTPYPYQDLKTFYKTKRAFYGKRHESFISKKSGSCKLLFIDSLIEHVCKGNILHEYWLENEGNGLYPPNSLEAMLRVMLVPDLDYDNKCAILLYFFLDLNMAIEEEVYKDVVANFIKFPSVFKLSAPLIKTVQAFWNLDHDHYLAAVDEFISPFNKTQSYPQWQVELLIEVLLQQNAANLALRILESQSSLISPLLRLNTLLANDMIAEAFHFARLKNDDALLETFYTRCLRNGQFGVIRDLALSDHEGLILQNILKNMKTPGAESLHFVYLLQKSKYIEAVSYMEEMSNRAKGMKASLMQSSQMDTPNLVLSAFNTTMTPVTQGLTDVYFRIKNKIKRKEIDNQSPVPLSCQLIKQNANSLLGGIYHSSALSAHFATYYWGEMEEQTKQTKHLLNSNNAPFLRRPQVDTNCRDFLNKNNISYPQAYKVNEKRTLIESGVHENEQDEFERQKMEYKLNPKKKRRLIGQEIVDDLAGAMRTNKTTNATEFNFGPAQQQQQQRPSEELSATKREPFDILLLPVATSKPKEIDEPKASQTEIQGILKTSSSDSSAQREPLNEEEKNLRFRLPSIEANATQLYSREEVTFNDEASLKTMANKEEQQKSSQNSPTFKHFTRSVSVESNGSSSHESLENFYSPLSSPNNSKLNCSNISRQSILSGPQPRKPLARFSAERSEKSLTPEKFIKPTDSTQYLTALETNIKSSISPRSSLERFKAEAAAASGKKSSSNLSFVTAKESLVEPTSLSFSKAKDAASDLGGISCASHATLTVNRTDEFVPKESSSKVGAIEPVKCTQSIKISECTTVLDSLIALDSSSNINIHTDLTVSSGGRKHSDEQKRHMLETTLGMSTYDFSVLESTTVQRTKSSAVVEDTTSKLEVEKEKEVKNKSSSDLESSLLAPKEKYSNDVCIVLSSSSSSSNDSSTFQQQQEDDFNEDYDKEEDEEEDEEYDYEKEEEEEAYESDNEPAEVLDEYEIDNEVNMENSYEQSETEVLNEYMEDDYDEDEEDVLMGESDISSANEHAEAIQLIEDSSSDVQPQHYDDSDSSDDVNVVEDEISTDVMEQKKKKKTDMRAEQETKEGDKNTTNMVTSSTLASTTAEKQEEAPEIDIRASEVVSVSITSALPACDAEEVKKNNAIDNRDQCVEQQPQEEHKESDLKVERKQTDDSKPMDVPQAVGICISKVVSISTNKIIPASEVDELKQNVAAKDTSEKLQEEQKESDSIDKGKEAEGSKVMDMPHVKGHQEESKPTKQKGRNTQGESQSIEPKQTEEASKEEHKTQQSAVTKKGKEALETPVKENIEQKAETKRQKKENNETLEEPGTSFLIQASIDESSMKQKTVDQIEKQPETINEKSEALELKMQESSDESLVKEVLEEHSLELKMPESNDESPVKEIPFEKKSDTVDAKPDNKEVAIRMQESQDDSENKETNEGKADTETSSEIEQCDAERAPKSEYISVATNEKSKEKIRDTSESAAEKKEEEQLKTEGESESTVANKKKEDLEIVMEIQPANDPKLLQSKRQSIKSTTSLMPKAFEPGSTEPDLTPRRATRGTSVPPQANIDSGETVKVTPNMQRSNRATSLQPKSKIVDNDMDTPRLKTHTAEEAKSSEKTTTRGSSVPPGAAEGKVMRRRSVLLEAINEDASLLDSPSAHTRLRSRLNSVDSDVDSPLMQQKRSHKLLQETVLTPKRTRRDSINSQPETSASAGTPRALRARSVQPVQEGDTSQTPKRKRHASVTSHTEKNVSGATPRSLRSRSVVTVPEDEEEEDGAKSVHASTETTNTKSELKRQKISNEPSLAEDKESISSKSDASSMPDSAYATSRRLTRNQLAIMEKSEFLTKASTVLPPQNKRSKSRAKRTSPATADSDDAESVSSKMSTVSSVTGARRRVTRSSIKDKEDTEDDAVSLVSSVGSEKQLRTRRSKDKSSPSTTLSTIPEDAPIETKKRGRSAKH